MPLGRVTDPTNAGAGFSGIVTLNVTDLVLLPCVAVTVIVPGFTTLPASLAVAVAVAVLPIVVSLIFVSLLLLSTMSVGL